VGGLFASAELNRELEAHCRRKTLLKDELLLAAGDTIVFLPIVLSGVVRIIRQSVDDKEVFLYHLYPGDTCAMAISCCMAGRKSTVKAVAEDDTELLLVPVNRMELLDAHLEWKKFINDTYARRFAELLEVIDLIAFNNMDKQLLHYLQQRARANNTRALVITHQQIADELHTHREAISRLLRAMEQKGLVHSRRNVIELLTDN
jgi:CRP/FNR family transcriptional regulator, anaerobic regulatory protein